LTAFSAALRHLPEEADFHFAMARTYRALGRPKDAERSFQAALERATSASIRERYVREYR
jgi:Tfp pilus assembly protein PilF